MIFHKILLFCIFKVENLVTIIGKFREREKLKSETVTNEGLKVIKR